MILTAHMITVLSYLVLGIGLAVPSTALMFMKTARLEQLLDQFLKHEGTIAVVRWRRVVEMYLFLFGVFIFACAIDHFTADHPHHFQPWFVEFAANFEAAVSGITAMLFALGPVAAIWKRMVVAWLPGKLKED